MTLRRAFTSLRIERLMAAVLLLCLFVMAVRPITDPDFWWHLRTGQFIWESRSIPRQDVFSYTVAGQPWITHEWLTEVLIYALYAAFGQGGLILVFAAIITAAFALLYLQCPGQPYLASFVVVWAAITSAVTWGVRPQMITLLLSSAFLYVLHLYRRGQKRLVWLMPPLMILWANLHGSFLLGAVLPAVYCTGWVIDTAFRRGAESRLEWRELRKLVIVTALTTLASVVNPNGVQLLLYPFGTLGSPAMQSYIMEWFSPDFHLVQFQPLALYILVLLAALGLSRSTPSATNLLFLFGFGYASLRSARHIPLFVLTTAPMLAGQLLGIWHRSDLSERFKRRRHHRDGRYVTLNWLLLGLLVLGVTLQTVNALTGHEAAQRQAFPVDAADFLMENETTGNMYNLYHWGGYLIWRLYPEREVFIDGRADVYGDAFIEEYLRVYQLREGWEEPLEAYGVSVVLVDKGSSLSTVLSERIDWARVYSDDKAVIFSREESS